MPKIGPQSALRPRPLLGSAGFRRPCPPQKDPSDRIADLHAFALIDSPARVRDERPPAAAPLWWVADQRNAVSSILGRINERKEDAFRAGVERRLHLIRPPCS